MEAYKAKSIDEVIRLLSQFEGKGKVIAGGTDLIIDIRNKKLNQKL